MGETAGACSKMAGDVKVDSCLERTEPRGSTIVDTRMRFAVPARKTLESY